MWEEVSFWLSPELQHKLWFLKLLAWLVSLFFLGSILYFLIKTQYLKYRWRKTAWVKDYRRFKAVHFPKKPKEWLKVERLIKSDLLSENKLGVVKAAELLDRALKVMGYPSGDWSSRLSQAIGDESFDQASVLRALELKERILKNPDLAIKKEDTKKAVEAFQQTLSKLNYF